MKPGKPLLTFLLFISALLIILVRFIFYSLWPPTEQKTQVSDFITIAWAKWKPSDYLQELSKEFTKDTGIKVIITQDSWSDFQTVFFNEMTAKGQTYDMVGGDSQWIGRAVTQGNYVELTEWMKRHNVDKSMTESSIIGYSEYPKGSRHYWAVPLEGDAMGFAYRKDKFEDPKEKASFKLKYGYELDIPKTWKELRDIAEFFYRPDKDFYGIIVWCEPRYDGITMGVQTLVWAWGADIGDRNNFNVKGMLNSKEGIEALKAYKELYQYSSPEWKNAYIESNKALMQGKVAMVMSYFAFFPDLLNSSVNPYANVTGFFANPVGPKERASSMGGQGISIVSYSKKKEMCFKFLEWFVKDETQEKWAEIGGYTCNKKVLNSEKFLSALPYNRPFMESMQIVKDFWAVPEYTDLLNVSQKYWYEYMTTNNITAEEAMNAIAREWEKIFENAGYYKE